MERLDDEMSHLADTMEIRFQDFEVCIQYSNNFNYPTASSIKARYFDGCTFVARSRSIGVNQYYSVKVNIVITTKPLFMTAKTLTTTTTTSTTTTTRLSGQS